MSDNFPVTRAMRALREHGVRFEAHLYPYEERGGADASARHLGVDLHHVVKTLIMEDESRAPFVVLMHGDRNVSTKKLARRRGCRSIAPCKPEIANKHSGYLVGGTSPLGLRRAMQIYMEASIADLPLIYLNGGKRGFLVSLSPRELIRVVTPELISVATDPPRD